MLYHVPPAARGRAIDEIHRVLAPGGVVLVSSVLEAGAGLDIDEARRLVGRRFTVERVTIDANRIYHVLLQPVVGLHALARALEIPAAARRRRRGVHELALRAMSGGPVRALVQRARAATRGLLASRGLASVCGRLGDALSAPWLRTNVTVVARKGP